MEVRLARKPKTAMVRDGNSVVLRFITGSNEGRCVPTRKARSVEMKCARCDLPSFKGLPPFVKTLGFDKDGKPIKQFAHATCPGNVARNKAMIAQFLAAAKKRALELAKLPQRKSRTYNPRVFK